SGQIISERLLRVLIITETYAHPGVGCSAVDNIAAVPVRRRVHRDEDRPCCIYLDGLSVESELSGTVRGVGELDAPNSGEARQLANIEGAATDQLKYMGATTAGEAVARIQRRRRAIDRVGSRTTHKRVRGVRVKLVTAVPITPSPLRSWLRPA